MGQAKRKQVATKSKGSERSVDRYMTWIVDAYLVYIMTVFVLVCPKGYVEYDLNKRNLLYIGTVPFVAISILMILVSLANADNVVEYFKGKFGKTDLLMGILFVVWIVSYMGCLNKPAGFWGDNLRYVGFSFMGLTLLACWIISKYFKYEQWLLYLFLGVSTFLAIWQTLNMYGIDPLNWQMDRQYTHLVSTLANVNQNAFFDAVALAIAVGALLMAEKRVEQIVYGIAVFLIMIGGIASRSETYFFGAILVFMVAVGYAWAHVECLRRAWLTCGLFVLSVVVQRFGYYKWIEGRIPWYVEGTTGLLFRKSMIILMVAVILIYGVLVLAGKKWIEQNGKLISRIYLGIVSVAFVAAVGVVVYANRTEIDPASGSFLLNLKLQDEFGGYRGTIWKVTMKMFADGSVFKKMFGYGMDNYSTLAVLTYAEDLTVFGDQVLADAHNIVLDMLISSGVLGVLSLFGVIAGVLWKNIKQFNKVPMAACAIMCISAFLMAGMLNGYLIVVTPVFFALLGCFWKSGREVQEKETVEE